MKNKGLSILEKQIMDIVWEEKTASVRSILEKLQKEREIAYTTIATLLTRLEAKGMVKKHLQGKAYVYKPLLSKHIYSKNIATSFVQTFFNSFGDAGIISFAQSIEKLPKEKKDYFLKLIRTHGKNK